MASIDSLLEREYDRKRYNCYHFAGDAWRLLTGDTRLAGINEATMRAGELRTLFGLYGRVAGPTQTPSIVLMNNLQGELHMGICHNRRLLHIAESGVLNLPFDASLHTYRDFRFYQ